MRELSSDRCSTLVGAYRRPYNPLPAIDRTASQQSVEETWRELWEELFHQGDVDTASYAAVPALVHIHIDQDRLDWNLYRLCTTIELFRAHGANPPVPSWLARDYSESWDSLFQFGLQQIVKETTEDETMSILGAIAIYKNCPKLAEMCMTSEEEIDWLLKNR